MPYMKKNKTKLPSSCNSSTIPHMTISTLSDTDKVPPHTWRIAAISTKALQRITNSAPQTPRLCSNVNLFCLTLSSFTRTSLAEDQLVTRQIYFWMACPAHLSGEANYQGISKSQDWTQWRSKQEHVFLCLNFLTWTQLQLHMGKLKYKTLWSKEGKYFDQGPWESRRVTWNPYFHIFCYQNLRYLGTSPKYLYLLPIM